MKRDEAETIAAVAVTIAEELKLHEAEMVYIYDPFGGFPGFWAFCGDAGMAFRKAEEKDPEIAEWGYWIDAVDHFAKMVVAWVLNSPMPNDNDLYETAKRAILKARKE